MLLIPQKVDFRSLQDPTYRQSAFKLFPQGQPEKASFSLLLAHFLLSPSHFPDSFAHVLVVTFCSERIEDTECHVDHSPGASAGEPYFCRDPGPQASPSFRRFLRSLGEARPSSILSGYLRVADQEIIALRECVAPLKPADLGTSSSIATWFS